MELDEFLRALPKTETHLHFEGSLMPDVLQRWRPEVYSEPLPFQDPRYRYSSFADFDSHLLGHAVPFLTNAERYHENAVALFASHVEENVKYVEVSFHLPVIQFIDATGPDIVEAISSAAPEGLEVRVFAGMLRDSYAGDMVPIIDELHSWEGLAGVDLHGDETVETGSWVAPLWRRLREAGKVTKAHAGEFCGADRVREALDELGVRRVQHGVRAIEDESVMERARATGAVFDMAPLSNVKLGVINSLEAHPMTEFVRRGIPCTVSRDDTFMFPSSMLELYRAMAGPMGMTLAEIGAVARAGFEVADLSPRIKQHWLAQIDGLLSSA